MSLDGTELAPPTLAELVTAMDAAAAAWVRSRTETERASNALRGAMRRQIEAEATYRVACRRYEDERRQAT